MLRTACQLLAFLTGIGLAPLAFAAGETNTLHPQLEALRPFLGKTWRGEFKGSTPEKPTVDVARWERALNGQAVRILHSVNRGAYGGETILTWNPDRKALVYHYFTTAGFQTSGTMTIDGSRFTSHETVTGDADGVTEVKATGEVRPDGSMLSRSEYLKKGKWEPGHEVVYREDPTAEVVFR